MASGSNNPSENSSDRPLDGYHFTFERIHDGQRSRSSNDTNSARDIDSESVSESIRDFPEEFGRTYHAYQAGSYNYPNDEEETRRLEMQNAILDEVFEHRPFFSPWTTQRPPTRVLDIATGTGEWAVNLGDLFPSAEIFGIDLSPIQETRVPPNVWFYVQDASDPWEFNRPFDFIHARNTLGSFADFKTEIVQQAFDNLEPGGYFESCDTMGTVECDDGSLPQDCALLEWFRDLNRASEIKDRPLNVANRHRQWYEEVGFVDVQERIFRLPINSWPQDARMKAIGNAWMQNLLDGLSGFTMALFNRVYDRTEEDIQVTLAMVRRDLQNTDYHGYQNLHVVVGRKPFPHEVAAT